MNVDAIERRTGDFRAVALNLQWSTNAFLPSADRLGIRRRRAALPFCYRSLSALKPNPPKYSQQLNTLGDHIRKRRLDLGLLQNQVAAQIGVDTDYLELGEQRNLAADSCVAAGHQIPRL